MRHLNTRTQQGDTIIEVVLAFAIFAAVIASAMAVMNLGMAHAMRSLEITQVRQQIDNQVEILRYAHEHYIQQFDKDLPPPTDGAWVKIKAHSAAIPRINESNLRGLDDDCPVNISDIPKAFILTPDGDNIRTGAGSITLTAPSGGTLPPFAQIDYAGGPRAYGMWIQAIPNSGTDAVTSYIDFHIRACWDSSGSARPVNLGTIVRLYEPK